jgi:hypothetical protein
MLGLIIFAVCLGIGAAVFGGPLGFVVFLLSAFGSVGLAGLVSRHRRINLRQRQALRLIAKSRDGITTQMLAAHGYERDTLAILIGAGFVTETIEHAKIGNRAFEIVRVKITNAGRLALAWGRSAKDD